MRLKCHLYFIHVYSLVLVVLGLVQTYDRTPAPFYESFDSPFDHLNPSAMLTIKAEYHG